MVKLCDVSIRADGALVEFGEANSVQIITPTPAVRVTPTTVKP
jgi:hypothetical protein